MARIGQSIDLRLSQKLRDKGYRLRFFLAEASAKIAAQLITLRKKRGLTQTEVANLVGTRQPAISRAERADYQNWSFSTLRGIAEALDARIQVVIEPSEDILHEYDENHGSAQNIYGPTEDSNEQYQATLSFDPGVATEAPLHAGALTQYLSSDFADAFTSSTAYNHSVGVSYMIGGGNTSRGVTALAASSMALIPLRPDLGLAMQIRNCEQRIYTLTKENARLRSELEAEKREAGHSKAGVLVSIYEEAQRAIPSSLLDQKPRFGNLSWNGFITSADSLGAIS
jgi:transcriptional regulator with XRE-family HTH domain